eukprot:Gb_30120 [translate_table: standard]
MTDPSDINNYVPETKKNNPGATMVLRNSTSSSIVSSVEEKWLLEKAPPPIKVHPEEGSKNTSSPDIESPPSPKRVRELESKEDISQLPIPDCKVCDIHSEEKWLLEKAPPPIKVHPEEGSNNTSSPDTESPPSPKRVRELESKEETSQVPIPHSKVCDIHFVS